MNIDDERPNRFKRTMLLILLSLGAGVLLAIFTQIQGFVRFIFSLGAFYLGIMAFRHFESWGIRIAFIVLTLFIFLMTTAIVTAILYAKGKISLPAV